LTERLIVAGRASETNDIKPSFTWPISDYVRFAEKIDALAANFVCQSEDENDNFKDYLTTASSDGGYPLSLPVWGVSNLHKRAFAKADWSTNTVLHSWLGMTNHAVQTEVASAITCLVWTAVESDDRQDHRYYQCSQYGQEKKADPCFCDSEPYPSADTNDVAKTRTMQNSHWSNGKITDETYTGYGQPIYAVGGMLCIDYCQTLRPTRI